ncbi:serine/threonine protein kinase [Planctomycetales bacterium]|nr:serine/threonine protein kinase [Planctomycetales bacterium]
MKTRQMIPLFWTLLIFALHLCGNPLAAQFSEFSDTDGGGRIGKEEVEEIEYEYPSARHFSKKRQPQVQAEERVRALSRFSLEFYAALTGDEKIKNQNIVCSPWNAALLLTMLYDGAEGDTAKEIRKALHFQGNFKLFEKYLYMTAFNIRAKRKHSFNSIPLLFDSANSFWGQKNYSFRSEYKELLSNRFCAEIFLTDFQKDSDKAVQEINDWCAAKTRQEITQILTVSDVPPETRMMILSAVYFKGRWESVFNTSKTKPEWFHYADGSVGKTATMNKEEYMDYYESNTFKAIRKDYCGNAHILILLPDEPEGLSELEKTLTSKKLRQINNQFMNELVKIKILRFAFEYQAELIPVLKTLGIQSVFDSKVSDLSKITDEKGFYIDFFRQTGIIKLDEEGTVAAAISGGGGMGGMPPKPKTFYADRPFLFMVCESTDNSILFMGRVHQPENYRGLNPPPL